MQKQYIFINHVTDEMCGFNANSLQQSKAKMRRISRTFFHYDYKTWSFVKTDTKFRMVKEKQRLRK